MGKTDRTRADTIRSPNVDLMLDHRLKRRPNINPLSGESMLYMLCMPRH